MNNFYSYEWADLFSCGLYTFVSRENSISKDQWAIFKSYLRKMKERKLLIKLAIDFYVQFNRQLIKKYTFFLLGSKSVKERSEKHIQMFTYIALAFFFFVHQTHERKKSESKQQTK